MPTSPFFGIVNQLIYGLEASDLSSPTVVESIATALIEQRYFSHPVETYYAGARKYLDSAHDPRIIGKDLPVAAIRSFLTGVLEQLDSRRPWAEPSCRVTADDDLWSAPRSAASMTEEGAVSLAFELLMDEFG